MTTIVVVGDIVEDIVVPIFTIPAPATQVEADIDHRLGGSAAATAVHLAQEGILTKLVCRVGEDEVGRLLTRSLQRLGVKPLPILEGRTSTVVVYVFPDGDRSFVASTRIRGRSITTEEIVSSIHDVDWLHLSGYWLTSGPPLSGIEAIKFHSRESGVGVSLDLGNVSRIRTSGAHNILAAIDALQPRVVFGNKAEYAALDTASQLATECTVITDSGNPVEIVTRRGTTLYQVDTLDVTTTLGAGDAFVAGFLSGYTRQLILSGCVTKGCQLARDHLTSNASLHLFSV